MYGGLGLVLLGGARARVPAACGVPPPKRGFELGPVEVCVCVRGLGVGGPQSCALPYGVLPHAPKSLVSSMVRALARGSRRPPAGGGRGVRILRPGVSEVQPRRTTAVGCPAVIGPSGHESPSPSDEASPAQCECVRAVRATARLRRSGRRRAAGVRVFWRDGPGPSPHVCLAQPLSRSRVEQDRDADVLWRRGRTHAASSPPPPLHQRLPRPPPWPAGLEANPHCPPPLLPQFGCGPLPPASLSFPKRGGSCPQGIPRGGGGGGAACPTGSPGPLTSQKGLRGQSAAPTEWRGPPPVHRGRRVDA